MRFSIKSLILVTAVVAAFGLFLNAARSGQTVACLLGLALYLALVVTACVRGFAPEKANDEREKTTGKGDETNPTT